jgi:eukaryotic-like serine/threonine-protein kinase
MTALEEERIFHSARQIKDRSARAKFIRLHCGQDESAFRRMERLLDENDKETCFLGTFPSSLFETCDIQEQVTIGTKIGRYQLIEEIGQGGYGVVHLAEQLEPVRRRVALKLIKPGMDSREVVARFENERQALALMDHPNICQILDGGQTESGRPFFVMDLVVGTPICKFADEHRLSIAERIELMTTVVEAVQYAHQKGIIHRDLKPSNILVSTESGKPFVKIIDFGIAKAIKADLEDRWLETLSFSVVGTPLYMSPEQASASGDVDVRSDVYALGVVLYRSHAVS